MKVLIACEYSGRVRDAFEARGHDAVSCDLLPTDTPGPHYIGNVQDILADHWDMMIAHPPCTYLCSSGLHWNTRRPGRAQMTEDALDFVRRPPQREEEQVDVVFLDPPYDLKLTDRVLALLPPWLASGARVYLETDVPYLPDVSHVPDLTAPEASQAPQPASWRVLRAGRAGQVCHHLLEFA